MRIIAFVAGLIFGFGLLLSGMTNPAKVRAFLDITGHWDLSLAFVMGGAVLTALPAFAWVRRRAATPIATQLARAAASPIDAPLLIGAALFGLGWGWSGLCPGPALVVAASGNQEALVFVAALAVGTLLSKYLLRPLLNK